MVSPPFHSHRSTELDPKILSTPFLFQTNWHVITGAPSCGKTTLINMLADKGYLIAPEAARMYMEGEIAKGRTPKEIRANRVFLECIIKEKQLEIEAGLEDKDCIFLDRAVPDNLAWYRANGLDPNELLQECFYHRYASIFLLDRLPLHDDQIRIKNTELMVFLEKWHNRDYNSLGYTVTRVPVIPPQERLDFVLRVLIERGLKPL